jgi:hypothetical protein
MENLERARRAPRKCRQTGEIAPVYPPACRCGLPVPSSRDWYTVMFSDGARLYISIEQFWRAGNCPVSALDRLIREFNLAVEAPAIFAPFAFSDPDDPGRVCRFLHAICRLTVVDYDNRLSNAETGRC